jgi:hypothetical protein
MPLSIEMSGGLYLCPYDLKGYHITWADSAGKCLIKQTYLLSAIIIIIYLFIYLFKFFLQLGTILNNEASVLDGYLISLMNDLLKPLKNPSPPQNFVEKKLGFIERFFD